MLFCFVFRTGFLTLGVLLSPHSRAALVQLLGAKICTQMTDPIWLTYSKPAVSFIFPLDTRWVVRFGHQVSASHSGRRSHRHIPNPNVSVGTLRQAAMKWVGGWDDEDDEDFESAEEGDSEQGGARAMPLTLAGHPRMGGAEMRGSFGSMGTPLGVLREESGAPVPVGFSSGE